MRPCGGMGREAEAEAEGWGGAEGLHLEVAMHDVHAVQVLDCDGHLRREGAAARGCAGRRGAAQCVHARAMRCVRCAACAALCAMRCVRLRPRPRERPPGVRGVRAAGGRARLCEDGESIVLLERALGQQVLEELPARQALLRSASRRRVGRGASRAATRVLACGAVRACRAAGRPRRPRLGLDDA